ncbi:hypothetical protein [uncultured Tateyamaria sp.]|uniref:hypothetical protein n=1 Tax=uncultured Tateyamaria sp. TaxID=455651 RepID=UPI00260DD722|nr:hypothetical protein [uncultured Tateyamaria sp.]
MEKYLAGMSFAVLFFVIAYDLGAWSRFVEPDNPFNSVELVSWVTAAATAVLALLTLFLAKATANMARATSEPQVVASIEVNQWSVIHFDLVVENTGNATAFDVQVKFQKQPVLSEKKSDRPFPFTRVSLLRPGQILTSYLAGFENLEGMKYPVTVSWKRHPNRVARESVSYIIDMNSAEGVSFLGRGSALVQIADEIKKMRNDWKPIASGNRRLDVDTYTQVDRDAKEAELEAWREEVMRKRESGNQ